MTEFNLSKTFKSSEISGAVVLTIKLTNLDTDEVISTSNRTVSFNQSYTYVNNYPESLFKANSMIKVSYIMNNKTGVKKIIKFGDDYYYVTPNLEFVPSTFHFNSRKFGETLDRPPLYSVDINRDNTKKLEPNPKPFSFDRYDATKMFEDDTVTFDNREDFVASELPAFNINNKTLRNISKLNISPSIQVVSSNNIGYETMEVLIAFGLYGPDRAYKDEYYLDIIKNEIKIKTAKFKVNSTSKNIKLSRLNPGDRIRFNLVYKDKILVGSESVEFKLNKNESKLNKVISYDF